LHKKGLMQQLFPSVEEVRRWATWPHFTQTLKASSNRHGAKRDHRWMVLTILYTLCRNLKARKTFAWEVRGWNSYDYSYLLHNQRI
jgi:hypothetical protein